MTEPVQRPGPYRNLSGTSQTVGAITPNGRGGRTRPHGEKSRLTPRFSKVTLNCVTERLASLSAWWAYGGLFALVFARVQAVYWLGRLTARGVRSRRWGQRLEGPRVRRAEELLNRYGAPAVTVSLLTPGVQTAVNALAGITRMPFVRYVIAMTIGCAAWALVYTAGLAAVWAWIRHALTEPRLGIPTLIIALAAGAVAARRLVIRRQRRQHHQRGRQRHPVDAAATATGPDGASPGQ